MTIIPINVTEAVQQAQSGDGSALQGVIDELVYNANNPSGSGDGSIQADMQTGEVKDVALDQVLFYLYRYIHLRYSASANGASFSADPDAISGDTIYIGIGNTPTETAPTSAASYNWVQFTWSSSHQVHYRLIGGRNFDLSTSTSNPTAPSLRATSSTGAIDLDGFSQGLDGEDAYAVVIDALEATTGQTPNWATFANTTQASPDFKNNTAETKALRVRVYQGGVELADSFYSDAGTTYQWRKNGVNFTPNATQVNNVTGTAERVILINQNDVADGNMNEIFTCRVQF